MDKYYGGITWTNHALQRLSERGIKQGDTWAVWSRPDESRFSTTKGAWVYYRTFNDIKIEVVAKKEEDKWIILSVWSKKIIPSKAQPLKWWSLLIKFFKQK